MELIACVRCDRHVRATEEACPFCEAPLEGATPRTTTRPRVAAPRTRSMIFGLGAAVLGATAAGCGGATEPADDGGVVEDGGPEEDASLAMPYGTPPVDHLL